jgi:hypothetical protein
MRLRGVNRLVSAFFACPEKLRIGDKTRARKLRGATLMNA